jgi:hypothetical protein
MDSEKAEPQSKKLFKFYLDQYEQKHNTRPEFLYRMNRNRFNTAIMRPISWYAPWYNGQGWIAKGAVVYFLFYWLIKKQPYTKHWNREGYFYEKQHKTPNKQF